MKSTNLLLKLLLITCISFPLFTCFQGNGNILHAQEDVVTEVEAEDGILTGVSVASSKQGYSGSGYVTGLDNSSDEFTIYFNIPVTGLYRILIRYHGSNGTKTQYFSVNAGFNSSVVFPASSTFSDVDAGKYELQEGENSITIKSYWGWTDFDRFTILKTEKNDFILDPALSDPQATDEAKALYEFLKMQFGSLVISGQTSSSYDAIVSLTGKHPMLKVEDMQPYTNGYAYDWNGGHVFGWVDDGRVESMIDWYKSTAGKGIVGFQWHWHSPSGGEAGTNTFYTGYTSFDITKAVQQGTEEYDLIMEDIDSIATQLKKFSNEGIPVLWRPLHEAGGGWFWWGAKGSSACIELYTIIYNRLTNFHHLHNLVWVWSTPEEDWYPGSDRVDIIGYDSYPGEYNYGVQKASFDQLFRITGGNKIIAMTENGPIPDIDACLSGDAPWSFFMSWSNLVFEQNSNDHLVEVYNNENVLTLESENIKWRSILYPENWKPGTKDSRGRFLHDFSYAGYHNGEKEVPDIHNNILDVTLPPYNADNTGTADATSAIQQALDDAGSSGGGVVYLPAGTYRIFPGSSDDHSLWMKYDNTILRGAGPDSTFLFNDADYMRSKDIITIRSNWSNWMTENGTVSRITADIPDPSRIIPIESVSGFNAGDYIIVRSDATDEFIAEHGMEGIWTETAIKGIAFYRRIDSVSTERNLVFINSPTRYPVKTRDHARIYHAAEHIIECGVKDLSIGNRENLKSGWDEESYTQSGTGAYDAHYSHAIHFKFARDCWVKNVHTYRPGINTNDIHLLSNCLLLEMSATITVDSCDFQKPQYEGGGGNGYMYTLGSNDCLIRNSSANDARHNYDFKYPYSNGNVIHRCRGENSIYASDFHMYLSMSNLFDEFTVNADYLESAFRPYGGTAIHGYSSTQSVFYNTKGEVYHPNHNYIVDSRQFNWGYVIGTSGAAYKVNRYPVSETQNGYSYDTAPTDFLEGEGKGSDLIPSSLYLDQVDKRHLDSLYYKNFNVGVLVTDQSSGEPISNCKVRIYNTEIQTGETGLASFEAVYANFFLDVEKEGYQDISGRQINIYSDTMITITLKALNYEVRFRVLDFNRGSVIPGCTVSLDSMEKLTGANGECGFLTGYGLHNFSIAAIDYNIYEGSLDIRNDTTVEILLTRSHASISFELLEETLPVSDAAVTVGGNTLLSGTDGKAVFAGLVVPADYPYQVTKTGYEGLSGTITLEVDTAITLEMNQIADGIYKTTGPENIHIWPNPATETLLCYIPGKMIDIVQIVDPLGRCISTKRAGSEYIEIDLREFSPGMYLLKLFTDTFQESRIIVKE